MIRWPWDHAHLPPFAVNIFRAYFLNYRKEKYVLDKQKDQLAFTHLLDCERFHGEFRLLAGCTSRGIYYLWVKFVSLDLSHPV